MPLVHSGRDSSSRLVALREHVVGVLEMGHLQAASTPRCGLLGIHSDQLKVIIIVLMFISTLVAAGFETQFTGKFRPKSSI